MIKFQVIGEEGGKCRQVAAIGGAEQGGIGGGDAFVERVLRRKSPGLDRNRGQDGQQNKDCADYVGLRC